MSTTTPAWLELLKTRAGRTAPAPRATRGELWIACIVALVLAAIPVGRAIVDGRYLAFAVDTATSQAPWSEAVRATSADRDARVDPQAGAQRSATAAAREPATARETATNGAAAASGGGTSIAANSTASADPGVGTSSGAAGASATARARVNTELSDQGIALYPAYRFTAEEIAAQRFPLWNSALSIGMPWLANPHWGVLDPQVLVLSALEIVGGHALFDRGLAWLAWLRIGAAALGAYVLARRLGTSPCAAAVSAAGFAGSGVLLAWLNEPAGHVVAVVPWLFVALERLRDRASGARAALVALVTALVILGGQPETAFFAGVAALAWTWFALAGRARTLAVAGLVLGACACAPLLVPFAELLHHSSALVARRATSGAHGFDLVALGLVVVTVGLVGAWRGLDPSAASAGRGLAGTIGVVFAFLACAAMLSARGAGPAGRLLFLHDAFGSHASGTWHGPGMFVEAAMAWLPAGVVVLALASFFSSAGTLRARGLIQVLALCALLLAIGVPGVVDLWRRLPFFGMASTARASAVAALFLSILAGEALDVAPRVARRTAGLVFVALVSLALVARAPPAPRLRADPVEPYFGWTETPPPVWQRGTAAVAGFVADTLPCDRLVLRAERLTDDGRILPGSAFTRVIDLAPKGSGRRAFRVDDLDVERFSPGTWRFSLDLYARRAGDRLERTGSRDVSYSSVAPQPRMSPASMAFTMLAFLSVLFLAGPQLSGIHARWKWLVVALLVAQSLLFARGLVVSVTRAQQFGPTRTEALLRARAGDHRVLGGPGVLPGNTNLLSHTASADGSTALELDAFEALRAQALEPGPSPARTWNAATVDVASNAFRMLGVSLLAARTRTDFAGFDLVAGPEADCPAQAETFVYAARAPLPRAWCAARVVERSRVRGELQRIDPRAQAYVEDDEPWRPAQPFTTSRAEIAASSSDTMTVTADLDGDGLLILTDADYPGWAARVDGRDERVITADGFFRGVPLHAGKHTVELEYAPASVRIGAWIGVGALGIIALLAAWSVRPSASTARQPPG